MQIPSLSSELEGPKEARCTGETPSSNSAAYSQLDEMPHIYLVSQTSNLVSQICDTRLTLRHELPYIDHCSLPKLPEGRSH